MENTQELPKDCATFLEGLTDLVEGDVDAPKRAALEAHISTCAACAAALDRRRIIVGALRSLVSVAAPEALDRVITEAGSPATLVRLSLGHVERLAVPAELDERVLAPSLRGAIPRRFVVIQRRRHLQQVALAALVLFGVGTATYTITSSRSASFNDEEDSLPAIVHERPNAVPAVWKSMAEMMAGGVPRMRKG